MTKIWAFVRHNSGIIIGIIIALVILCWCYGCPSRVVSIVNSPVLVTRVELELEVDHFLKSAEIRFAELDQQDEFKRAIFAVAMKFMANGKVNPGAVAIVLGNILGLGAILDNLRKRTYINTLKGDIVNGRINRKTEDKKTEAKT